MSAFQGVNQANNRPLRGAVVGVGYLGNFHAQKYKALAERLGFEFFGVCDLFAPQAEKIGKELGVYFTDKPESLLGKVDFVTIATTTSSHYQMAKLFLSHGIHVNVEKPMTATVSEGKELLHLAEQRGLLLTVGHSERFSPVFAELKSQIQGPSYYELQRHAPYKERGADVSVVHDLMIHDLDLLLNLQQGEITKISAKGGRVISPTLDWLTAQISFATGQMAVVSVSRLAPEMTRTLKVNCTQTSLLANFQTGDLEIGRVTRDKLFVIDKKTLGRGDNLLLETENFILSLQGKARALVPGHDGLRALELAERIIERAGQQ